MQRPYFIPYTSGIGVEKKIIDFKYYSGFSPIQKMKTIESFHNEIIKNDNNIKVLEICINQKSGH